MISRTGNSVKQAIKTGPRLDAYVSTFYRSKIYQYTFVSNQVLGIHHVGIVILGKLANNE